MGKALGLTVVAEGIETTQQEMFLRQHGCDEIQGYLFSKPIANNEFSELMRQHMISQLKTLASQPLKSVTKSKALDGGHDLNRSHGSFTANTVRH